MVSACVFAVWVLFCKTEGISAFLEHKSERSELSVMMII